MLLMLKAMSAVGPLPYLSLLCLSLPCLMVTLLTTLMMLLMLQGSLKEGWRDVDGTDLSELTWAVGKKISADLTPQALSA